MHQIPCQFNVLPFETFVDHFIIDCCINALLCTLSKSLNKLWKCIFRKYESLFLFVIKMRWEPNWIFVSICLSSKLSSYEKFTSICHKSEVVAFNNKTYKIWLNSPTKTSGCFYFYPSGKNKIQAMTTSTTKKPKKKVSYLCMETTNDVDILPKSNFSVERLCGQNTKYIRIHQISFHVINFFFFFVIFMHLSRKRFGEKMCHDDVSIEEK